MVTSVASTIDQNCTYIRNPNYPSALDSTSSLTYTIKKCSQDVCQVRLDFISFTIAGPSDTAEAANYACTDTFIASVSFQNFFQFLH